MSSEVIAAASAGELRSQAMSRLTGRSEPGGAWPGASAALGVLLEMASSPATAPDALALLHELQVHQIELELQNEELLRSRAELEGALHQRTQLFDFAPVACFSIDAGMVVHEVNRAGARLLGEAYDTLPGKALDSFLAPEAVDTLAKLLAQALDGRAATCRLQLATGPSGQRRLHATACVDPTGNGFLVVLVDTDNTF